MHKEWGKEETRKESEKCLSLKKEENLESIVKSQEEGGFQKEGLSE